MWVRRQEQCLQINLYRSAVTALRKLPNEILAEIFTHCVDEVSIQLDPCQLIWTLANVCSRWRQIVFDTPSLWKCPDLRFNGFPAQDDVN